MNKIVLLFVILITISSCKHETLEDIPIKENCETGTIDFVNQVLPILESNCSTTGCHNESSHKHFVVTDNYYNLIKSIDVNAGNAEKSELYEVITDNSDDIMPPSNSGFVLTQIQKDIIKKWINQGAKNIECTNYVECDSSSFKYTLNVKPLLDESCVSCHSSGNSTGTTLDNYTDLKISVESGSFLNSIKHISGTSAMPQGIDKWDDCKIAIIEKWINDGAQNN